MKIRLNPHTRLEWKPGQITDYGAEVEVPDDMGRALTTGPNPCAVVVDQAPDWEPFQSAPIPATEEKEKEA